MSKNILVVVHPKIGACQFFRQIHPHENFSKDFKITYRHVLDIIPNKELTSYQLVQIHKSMVTVDFLRKLKGLQIPSIVDFDDYWNLPTTHTLYKHYLRENTSKELLEVLKLADYVSVTTNRLAEEVRKQNKNVYVLPNAIDPQNHYAQKINMTQSYNMQIGYLGGSTHINDVELIRGLNNKLVNSGLDYTFNLFGYKHDTAYQRYAEIITSKAKYTENLQLHAPLPVPEYLVLYNMVDVALAPLCKNKFNSLKSELKLIEAGTFKIPVIASGVDPYKGIIRHRKNGLIADNKSDWFRHTRFFIKNPKAVKDFGNQLHTDIQTLFNYDKIKQEREELYRHIIKKWNN